MNCILRLHSPFPSPVPYFLFCLLALASLLGPPARAETPDDKSRIPDDAAQARAEKTVRDLFKADYARKKAADVVTLARKLLQGGIDTADDPALRFVLLREARDLAAQAGEVELTFQALGEIARLFHHVDLPEAKKAALTILARSAREPEAHRWIATGFLALAYEAAAAKELVVAERLVSLGKPSGAKSQSEPLKLHFESTAKEIPFLERENERVAAAQAALAQNPADGRALLTLGKHLCLTRGEWKAGVERLASCVAASYKTLAGLEKSRPADPASQVSLGDAWWDLAEHEEGVSKEQHLLQARYWYLNAQPGLKGLTHARAAQRVTERLERIERAVRFIVTKAFGGGGGGPFQEVSPGRSYLVGLRICSGGVIHSLQPIFEWQDGRPDGRTYGKTYGTGSLSDVAAKQGYAVGGLVVKTGLRVDGLKIVFMKLAGGRLDPGDSYESSWFGGRGGAGERALGCTGKLVVGIHGGCGLEIDRVGLVLAP